MIAGPAPRSPRHPAYAADAPRDAVFHMPEPDGTPLSGPTRTALVWDGRTFTEIDPATGRELSTGHADPELSSNA